MKSNSENYFSIKYLRPIILKLLSHSKFLIAWSSQIFIQRTFLMNLFSLSLCHVLRGNLFCHVKVLWNLTALHNYFNKVVTEFFFCPCNNWSVIHRLFSSYRQAKIDGRTASAKIDEMTRLTEKLQGQLERKVF